MQRSVSDNKTKVKMENFLQNNGIFEMLLKWPYSHDNQKEKRTKKIPKQFENIEE